MEYAADLCILASIFAKPKRLSENNDQELSKVDFTAAYKVRALEAPKSRPLTSLPEIHDIPQDPNAGHPAGAHACN